MQNTLPLHKSAGLPCRRVENRIQEAVSECLRSLDFGADAPLRQRRCLSKQNFVVNLTAMMSPLQTTVDVELPCKSDSAIRLAISATGSR